MLHVNTGQCGLCVHFGEEHPQDRALLQIRSSMAAAEDFLDECHHPTHEGLHLKVTAVSGCDGFEPAVVH
jgi:hypothetical protein